MCLIYLLLRHHLKIVKLAKEQTVAVAEFEDMRETWEYLFNAFEKRMETLKEVWRQQRLNIKNQMECFAGGMFENWYAKVTQTDTLFLAMIHADILHLIEPGRGRV